MEAELDIELDIYSACNIGDEDLVEKIIKRETTDINERNLGGWTPLMYACWGGYEKLVTLLQNCGARAGEMNGDNQTALIIAVKSGCLNIVKLVFQEDLFAHRDYFGKCALFYAVDFGYYDISSYLLSKGADANVSCDGITVLMVAAMNGQSALVELLLKNGANVHMRNNQGFTAQQLAQGCGHLNIADMLDPTNHALPDLKSFLESLGLQKYWPIFQENGIDFKRFLQLDEADIKSLGIKLLGPRRKLSLAIASFKKQMQKL